MKPGKLDYQLIPDSQIPAPLDGRIMPISKETRRFHRSEAALTIGKTIGNSYVAERVIGNGGMSIVYEATDRKSGKKAAVKVYNANNGFELVNPEHILAKAAVIANIKHPHIVEVLGMGIHEDRAFVAMEMLSGITLQDYIANNSNPSWKTAKGIILQICCSLDVLHKANIIHMDVKPSNVFVGENGVVKIFDFDISLFKYLEERPSFSLFIGSEQYASPEQFKGKRHFDPRIDVYSLGIMMYELASGRHPFQSNDMAELLTMHLSKMPKPPSDINPCLPPEADATIMKALEKKPEMRFQNMEEMMKAILVA